MDDPVIAPQLKLRPALSQHDVGPEEPSLFAGTAGQLLTAHAMAKTQVVADQ
jgi:hypothetical protein